MKLKKFRGVKIPIEEKKILKEIESEINFKFSKVDRIKWNTKIGFTVNDNNRVSGIVLHNCGIKILPESIGNLKSLETLGLGGNLLSTLPESIGNLKSLETLGLGGNLLSTLPESIGNLSSLQRLMLAYNQLTMLPESIGDLKSLKVLFIGANKLKRLPDSIGELKSLSYLNLCTNNISTLPDSIGRLNSLKELWSSHNKLKTLPESIGNLISLLYLNLEGNKINSLPISIWRLKISNLKPLDKLNENDLLNKEVSEKLFNFDGNPINIEEEKLKYESEIKLEEEIPKVEQSIQEIDKEKDLWADFNKAMEIEKRKQDDQLKKRYNKMQLFNMAQSFASENAFEKAIDFYKLVIEKDPKYLLAWVNMGTIYTYYDIPGKVEGEEIVFYKRHYDEGIECFKKALELKSDDIPSLIGLGDAYQGKSLEYYNKEIKYIIPPNDTNSLIGLHYGVFLPYQEKSLDYLKKSIKYFEKVTEMSPKNLEAWKGIGFAFLKMGKYEKAISYFEKVLKYEDKDIDSLMGLGFYHFARKEYDKALEYIKRALTYQKGSKIIAEVIEAIESEKEEMAWRESDECKDLENKVKDFIRSYQEAAIRTIAENFFPIPIYKDKRGYRVSTIETRMAKDKHIKDANKKIKYVLNSLIERKIIRGIIRSYPNRKGLYYVNEDKINEEEIRKKREEQQVLNELLKISEKFTRIHVKELVEKLKMDESKVIKIVEKLTKNNKIPAIYDSDSKGIEFHIIDEDIDKLLEKFNNWSEKKKNKKI